MKVSESVKNIFQVILLALVCVISAFLISYPFWIFSIKLPSMYSVFFMVLFAAFLIYAFVKAVKKYSFFRTFRIVVFIAILVFAVTGIVHFVLIELKIPALIIFLLVFPVEIVFMKITGKFLNEKK